MEGHIPDDNSGINISDVIEVIETDQVFGSMHARRPSAAGVAGNAYLKIIEQPAPKALRFRYECEGRSAGSLPGISSTPENKTYPTIQIVGYKGRAVVIVSCVTKDQPFRPHPHNLVGKENCKRGICTVEVSGETMTAALPNLGIQCVKKKDIEEALKVREERKVDPFKTGFAHKTQNSTIDLNSVRLCFQTFLEGPEPNKFTIPLKPVVSDPIYDKKAMADLIICKLSHCSASVAGGQEVILLCEKVAKEDITVRFFEVKDGKTVWEGYADFTPAQVHKQTAIAFRTPRYSSIEIEQPVQAWIQLRRPSDGETSEALPFQFTPLDADAQMLKRKRQKYGNENEMKLSDMRQLQKEPFIIKREPVTSPNPHQLAVGRGMGKQLSPHYSRTPSPHDYPQQQAMGQQYSIFPGSTATYIASSSTAGGHVYTAYNPSQVQASVPTPMRTEGTNILDMDTQQCMELNFMGRIDSRELADFQLLEGSLPNSFSSSLVLGEQVSQSQQQVTNNTDSFTRMANAAINDLCRL